MFQEFRTQNRTHAYSIGLTVLFPIWVNVYALFLRLTVFFPMALLDATVTCRSYSKI